MKFVCCCDILVMDYPEHYRSKYICLVCNFFNCMIEAVKNSIKSSLKTSSFSDNLHLLVKSMGKYSFFSVIVLDAVICKQYSSVAQ